MACIGLYVEDIKNRPENNNTRGNQFRDYYLGSSYYRDDGNAIDEIVLGGNVRIHFEGDDENFEKSGVVAARRRGGEAA